MNGPTFATSTAPAARQTPRSRTTEKSRLEQSNPTMVILTYLRLHWMMILFCGLLLGSGMAYTAYTFLPAKYESYALLLVSSTPPSIASQNDPGRSRTEFSTYIKTNAQLIKSQFVLNAALNDVKYRIGDLPTMKEQKDPIRYLDEKLMVNYSDGSEVVRITLEGDRPNDIRKIVDAVSDAFFREVVEKELKQKLALKLKVEEARTKLEGQMRGKPGFFPESGRTLAGMAPQAMPNVLPAVTENPAVANANPSPVQQTGGVVPVPTGAVSTAINNLETDMMKRAKFSALMQRYTQYEVELAQFPTVLNERRLEVESVKNQLDKLSKLPPTPEVMAAVEKDPEVLQQESEAKRMRNDYEYLRRVANNPNSERLARLKDKADQADAQLQKLIQDKAQQFDSVNKRADGERLTRNLEAAERNLRQLEERERVTRKLFEDAKKELADMPPDLRKEDIKKPLVDPNATDLLTHDDMYRRLTTQQIGLDLELQSPERIRRLQPASLPSQKDPKKQIIATIGAGLFGFVLIALGAVTYETRVRKISSLAELVSNTTTQVVGVLPWNSADPENPDPIYQADLLEAVDKLRGQVVQSYLAKGLTTITISSPLGDEGKAYTAYHLAKSMAESGIRTLLVDFDLRQPSLHQYAGLQNCEGMCELLREELNPTEAQLVLPCGMSFIPAGNWSEDSRRAAVSGRLEQLIRIWRESFDCVILHGHALLTVAESVEIARRSQVVLLCALYRETRLPLLKRATDRLASMDIQNGGIVYLGASSHEALC